MLHRISYVAELESAQAADYLFTLPIEITYENLDAVMLPRYFSQHPWEGTWSARAAPCLT